MNAFYLSTLVVHPNAKSGILHLNIIINWQEHLCVLLYLTNEKGINDFKGNFLSTCVNGRGNLLVRINSGSGDVREVEFYASREVERRRLSEFGRE